MRRGDWTADLGGEVVDIGEAHADEAAEALDLRRHVRRRHPRLHHLRRRRCFPASFLAAGVPGFSSSLFVSASRLLESCGLW